MKSPITTRVLAVLAGAAATMTTTTSAHSFVSNINIDRLNYNGWHPTQPQADPLAVGWTTSALDQGYVNQTGYPTEEIICHRDAANARAHVRVAGGDVIHIQWNGWPQSHKGPVLDYLARCDGPCEKADKNALRFFKIAERGLLAGDGADDDAPAGGYWASDQLIANNNSWAVAVPAEVQPGFYVLRTEIIALHNASHPLGAQNYPQCLNLQIMGNGTLAPAGLPGQALYDPRDPSMHLDIYAGLSEYRIPGPPSIWAAESVALSHPTPTGNGPVYTGTATTPATAPTTTTKARTVSRFVRPRPL
ncbi:putative endo-1,4-beta-glucanase [Xylariomycetidae sp. FL0641]|nr:putative endo-1,4-beta-glucanase [Xylariomycetidae sp. FL0641]